MLLDSVVLIDHFNGVEAATAFLRKVTSPHISAITRAEVLAGFDSAELAIVRALLDRFPMLSIDAAVADLGAELRRTHGWKLPDALQAAVARCHGLLLATRNTKDFPPERFEFVRVPYRL
ncbi:MAG: PIN domain-containing protein [Myxococcales bacterium]